MANTKEHYDLIIIGTGAGGGTLAHELALTGKKILILERGDFLPQEKENWSPKEVYQKHRYYTREQWRDRQGADFTPQTCYFSQISRKTRPRILRTILQLHR